MRKAISNYFGIKRAGTTWSREVVAGLTTFVTMSYIVVVNPAVLKVAGMPVGPSMVATILTAVVTAVCFLGALFFSPLIAATPAQAYGPALIIVGLLMLSSVPKIPFDDFTELIPAFTVVALMCFTYNIGIGITAGFVLFPFCKLAAGRVREVGAGLCLLAGMSLLFFVFYPST